MSYASKINYAEQYAANSSAALPGKGLSRQAIPLIQKMEPEEEEPLQGRFETLQKQLPGEEELPLQGKFGTVQKREPGEQELLQGKFEFIQRQVLEEEDPLQGRFILSQKNMSTPAAASTAFEPVQKKDNKTGLPDQLKSGIENLSGFSMDGVKVHFNSDKPAQLNALAYAQGTDIHVGPGQEKHLPHEAWHVVQQMQGRVQPTMQMREGVPVNDDAGLETEADVMGGKALMNSNNEVNLQGLTLPGNGIVQEKTNNGWKPARQYLPVIQRKPTHTVRVQIQRSKPKYDNSEVESHDDRQPITRAEAIAALNRLYEKTMDDKNLGKTDWRAAYDVGRTVIDNVINGGVAEGTSTSTPFGDGKNGRRVDVENLRGSGNLST